jgi:hypothetical protein
MGEVQTTALAKGLRPNSLKRSAHAEYLAKHYDTKSSDREEIVE